ncbi:MAG: PBSX family phage terminase large subunit, partial [Hymenobacter sp.]
MTINDAYLPIFTSTYRYNVLKGGAGAGKSRAIAQLIIRNLRKNNNYKVLALCKIGAMLSATVFAELKKVISDLNAEHLFTVTTSPLRIVCNANGNEVIFRGMDDENKLKSISGISFIWMEEADNYTAKDFLQADSRMRGKTEHLKQIFLSFNPTSELSWLKETFFDVGCTYEGKALVLETTYRDNKYLEPIDIEALELSGRTDKNFMRIYLNGEWGRVSSDGLFYKSFDSMEHVR